MGCDPEHTLGPAGHLGLAGLRRQRTWPECCPPCPGPIRAPGPQPGTSSCGRSQKSSCVARSCHGQRSDVLSGQAVSYYRRGSTGTCQGCGSCRGRVIRLALSPAIKSKGPSWGCGHDTQGLRAPDACPLMASLPLSQWSCHRPRKHLHRLWTPRIQPA